MCIWKKPGCGMHRRFNTKVGEHSKVRCMLSNCAPQGTEPPSSDCDSSGSGVSEAQCW